MLFIPDSIFEGPREGLSTAHDSGFEKKKNSDPTIQSDGRDS